MDSQAWVGSLILTLCSCVSHHGTGEEAETQDRRHRPHLGSHGQTTAKLQSSDFRNPPLHTYPTGMGFLSLTPARNNNSSQVALNK